jgi:hypothetical protein
MKTTTVPMSRRTPLAATASLRRAIPTGSPPTPGRTRCARGRASRMAADHPGASHRDDQT